MIIISRLFRFFYIILFFLLILSYYFIHGTLAFEEEFTNGLNNPSMWNVGNATGINYSTNSIILSSTSTTFPYLQTDTSVFTGNLSEIRFRFPSAGSNWGDGISLTDRVPGYSFYLGSEADYVDNSIFYVWHDKSPSSFNLHIVSTICPSNNPGCTPSMSFLYNSRYAPVVS